MNVLKLAAVLILLNLAAATPVQAKDWLTKEEVVATFIGKPWRSPGGTFVFRKDGTYIYTRHGQKTQGPWSYQVNPDGSLSGAKTTYRFFRANNGRLRYWHSTSNRNINVFLD